MYIETISRKQILNRHIEEAHHSRGKKYPPPPSHHQEWRLFSVIPGAKTATTTNQLPERYHLHPLLRPSPMSSLVFFPTPWHHFQSILIIMPRLMWQRSGLTGWMSLVVSSILYSFMQRYLDKLLTCHERALLQIWVVPNLI